MIVLLLIIVGVCAAATAVATFGRSARPDEIERFHRARAMTTEWSRHHPAHIDIDIAEQRVDERERESVDH